MNHGSAKPLNDAMLIQFEFNGCTLALTLRWDSSDFIVFEQIFIREEYLPIVTSSKFPIKQMCIIDAGANIGCTTIYFKTFYPVVNIIAIEPDPKNFERLLENLRLCGFGDIKCLSAAVWHRNGLVQLGRSYRDSRDWSTQVDENGKITVPSRTLQSILQEFQIENIDILKIDIEGAEISIFRNDKMIDAVLSKANHVAIEVHDDWEGVIEHKLVDTGFHLYSKGETLFGQKI